MKNTPETAETAETKIIKNRDWEKTDDQNGILADIIEKNQHAYPKPERQKV